MPTRRRGFTLIEILIVVLVIAILIALLMPVLAMVRRKGRLTATNQLIQQVATAMTTYLDRYPLLGDQPDSSDFLARPWKYLHANYVTNLNVEPPITLQLKQLSVGSTTYSRPDKVLHGEHILDFFPTGAFNNVLRIEVHNDPVYGFPNRFATSAIDIYSSVGTFGIATDDIHWHYSKTTGEWETVFKGK